jgi:hypothetical protein
VARTNSFVRESKEQSQYYHGQAKLVRATSPGALGTQEKVPALSGWLGPMQTLLNVTKALNRMKAEESFVIRDHASGG